MRKLRRYLNFSMILILASFCCSFTFAFSIVDKRVDPTPGIPLGNGTSFNVVPSGLNETSQSVAAVNSRSQFSSIASYHVSFRNSGKLNGITSLYLSKSNCSNLNPSWRECSSKTYYKVPVGKEFIGSVFQFGISDSQPFFMLGFHKHPSIFYRYYVIEPNLLESNPTWRLFDGEIEVRFTRIPDSP